MMGFPAKFAAQALLKKFSPSSLITVLPEVSEALLSGKPVVALESTIVAHGMPYPQNLELAREVSDILRGNGAIPATVAIKNGEFRVGLKPSEMEDLSRAGEEGRAIKCSTRDLPLLASKYCNKLTQKNINHPSHSLDKRDRWGATTVAATMRLAHAAGISTFVTGGTGGVHRGGELSLDISTDLIELSRTPVVVVSAGVKSILDIKRTLEVLETFGVPTGAWRSDDFPAFFSPVSGMKAPARFEDATEIASAYLVGRELGMENGMLVAVPNHDPAGENVESAIQEALKEVLSSGIDGKDVTPYVLRAVAEKSRGDSLRSNVSLVKRNAEVGADIASAICLMKAEQGVISPVQINQTKITRRESVQTRVVCVGGSVIDTIAKSNSETNLIIGTSNPGKFHRSHGGVGRNVAEVLGRLGARPLFYTAIGEGDDGQDIISCLENEHGVLTTAHSVSIAEGVNTAQYFALHDHTSDLVGGVADMQALSKIPIPSSDDLDGVDFILLDANAPSEKVLEAAKNAVTAGTKVCFEPTSVPKSQHLCIDKEFMQCVSYVFPNEDELFAMAEALPGGNEIKEDQNNLEGDFFSTKVAAAKLLSRMKSDCAHVVVTLGSRGVLLASKTELQSSVHFQYFPAIEIQSSSSNGAGDSLCGAFIYSLLKGNGIAESVQFGMKAAVLSLQHAEGAISPQISSMSTNSPGSFDLEKE